MTLKSLDFSKKVIDPCIQGGKNEQGEGMGQESSYMNFLG